MKRNGFTLPEVMIAIAIVAVLALTISIVYSNITRLTVKSESLQTTDQTALLLKMIFMNRDLCDNALRGPGQNGASATHLTLNPASVNVAIDHIQMYNPKQPAFDQPALSVNDLITPKVAVESITFQEISPGNGRSTVQMYPTSYSPYSGAYTVYAGYVQITFKAIGDAAKQGSSMAGGAPPPKQIPLTVAVGPANTIDACFFNASALDLCGQSGGQMMADGSCAGNILNKLQALPACGPGFGTPCGAPPPTPYTSLWVIDRFDNAGNPVCECVYVQ